MNLKWIMFFTLAIVVILDGIFSSIFMYHDLSLEDNPFVANLFEKFGAFGVITFKAFGLTVFGMLLRVYNPNRIRLYILYAIMGILIVVFSIVATLASILAFSL